MQVQWTGLLSTQLPVEEATVAQWLLAERPDAVRRLHGVIAHPTLEQIVAFMRAQPHFSNMAAGLYAQAHGLLGPNAQVPAALGARPLRFSAGVRARSGS